MTGARAAVCLTLALLALSPVRAMPPPPPPPHTRYGPLVQCLNGYAVTVAADEAVFLWDQGFTLVSERESFAFTVEDPDPYRAQAARVELDVPGVGTITRLTRGHGGEVTRLEYLIPGRDGARAVLAMSRGFHGTAEDLFILARIRPAVAAECGAFAAPDFAGEDPDALTWRRPARTGPAFHCQNGIGFALFAGETIQSGWSLYEDPAARLRSAAGDLIVHGPLDRPESQLPGPVGTRYGARLSVWAGRPNLLLAPPGPRPSRRHSDDSYRHWLRIEFGPGAEAAARALAGRFEFVAPDDPRCTTG